MKQWVGVTTQYCQLTDRMEEEEESSSSTASLSSSQVVFDGFQTITGATSLGKDDVFVTDDHHLATPNFSTYVNNSNIDETGTSSCTEEDVLKPVKEKLEKMQKKTCSTTNSCRAAHNYQTTSLHTRTSLWDLFQKTKTTEEKKPFIINNNNNSNKRRLIKTRMPSSINSASADEKLHKILRMLQRVHPEALAISQKSQNLWKYVMKSNGTNCSNIQEEEDGYTITVDRNQMLSEDIIIFPYTAISDDNHTKLSSNISNNLTYAGAGAPPDTNWKRECWIKSDAEYLILEL